MKNSFLPLLLWPYHFLTATIVFAVVGNKDTISLLKGLDTMFKYLGIYPAKLRCDNDVAIYLKIPLFL